VIGVLGTAFVAAASFWAGSQVHGSANTLPTRVVEPIPTAPIRHGPLVNDLATTGTVVKGPERSVRLLPVAADAGQPIVTRLPVHPQARLREGDVIAEVAGRPSVVLRGAIPMYRDLKTGTVGADVAQFQRALIRQGYALFDHAGYFGASTGAAAAAFFRSRGYGTTFLRPSGDDATRKATRPKAITVPGASVAYLRTLPTTVSRVSTSVGEELNGALLHVATGSPLIRATIDPEQVSTIHRGMRAVIASGSRRAHARVIHVSVSQGGGSAFVTIAARRRTRRLPVGEQVPVTIQIGRSHGSVWSVPFSAVFTRADGSTIIRTRTGGERRTVVVDLGFSAHGYVAIRPVAGPALRAMQPVEVMP
jgi:hypothetical protein